MPTQCRGAAASDRAQHFPVGPVNPAEVVLNEATPWARTISATSRRGGVIFSSVSKNVGCRRGWRLCSASSGWGWPADAGASDAPIVPQEPTFASSAILRSIFTSHLTSLGPSKFGSIRLICSKRRSLFLPRSVSMCPRCDAGVPPASFCVVGSRGPPFSVTELISNPPQLPILEHAVASAAPAASYKSRLHSVTRPTNSQNA
jgi:hypothetical protein